MTFTSEVGGSCFKCRAKTFRWDGTLGKLEG